MWAVCKVDIHSFFLLYCFLVLLCAPLCYISTPSVAHEVLCCTEWPHGEPVVCLDLLTLRYTFPNAIWNHLEMVSIRFVKNRFYVICGCSDNKRGIRFQSGWIKNLILAGSLTATLLYVFVTCLQAGENTNCLLGYLNMAKSQKALLLKQFWHCFIYFFFILFQKK